MASAIPMVEMWRGNMVESAHLGRAVVCGPGGEVVAEWGDGKAIVFPRSSCKMVQALPLLESGAGAELSDERLALACASHSGGAAHVAEVERWLGELGLGEPDLRCGAHEPSDRAERDALIRQGRAPCQLHNNCSGKHAGFLMLNRHLRGGPEYVSLEHPVQRLVREALEDVCGETASGHAIDGCSAPNFAVSLRGLARAMAFFARAEVRHGARARAAARLVRAMMARPEMVAGEGRACTALMRAGAGRFAVKTGAEGVFVAILPGPGLGVALKIADGATRASEAAVAGLLVHLGVLEAEHPVLRGLLDAPQRNWRGMVTGRLSLSPGFP